MARSLEWGLDWDMTTTAKVLFSFSAIAAAPFVLLLPASIAHVLGADALGQLFALPHVLVGGILCLVVI